MAATTLESTPPDMATTTRVSAGALGSPSELSGICATAASDILQDPCSTGADLGGAGPARKCISAFRPPAPLVDAMADATKSTLRLSQILSGRLYFHQGRVAFAWKCSMSDALRPRVKYVIGPD